MKEFGNPPSLLSRIGPVGNIFLSVALSGLIAAYTANRVAEMNFKATRDQRRDDDRHRAFAKLAGLRVPYSLAVQQEQETALTWLVLSNIIETASKKENKSEEDKVGITANMAKTWELQARADEMARRRSDVQRDLFETMADAYVAFGDDPKVLPMVQKILTASVALPKAPGPSASDVSESWQQSARNQYQKDIFNKIDKPILELVNELASKLGATTVDSDGGIPDGGA